MKRWGTPRWHAATVGELLGGCRCLMVAVGELRHSTWRAVEDPLVEVAAENLWWRWRLLVVLLTVPEVGEEVGLGELLGGCRCLTVANGAPVCPRYLHLNCFPQKWPSFREATLCFFLSFNFAWMSQASSCSARSQLLKEGSFFSPIRSQSHPW